jgi:SAM-dependent methyltransferase
MNGAKKVYLVDKYSRHIQTPKQKEYYFNELNYIKRKYTQPLFFIKDEELDQRYVEFIEADSLDLALPAVDLIMSISVLEHVKEYRATVARLAELLKPGGYMYHHIDLRDHYNFQQPFMFYRYPEWLWERWLVKAGVSYTNRARYDDFVALFKDNNLQIVDEDLTTYPGLETVRLAKQFEFYSHECLGIGIMNVLLQKMK